MAQTPEEQRTKRHVTTAQPVFAVRNFALSPEDEAALLLEIEAYRNNLRPFLRRSPFHSDDHPSPLDCEP